MDLDLTSFPLCPSSLGQDLLPSPFSMAWNGDGDYATSSCSTAAGSKRFSSNANSLDPLEPASARLHDVVDVAVAEMAYPLDSLFPHSEKQDAEKPDVQTPIGREELPVAQVQRTSFTMENLDAETRNTILDILCQRKISTTINIL